MSAISRQLLLGALLLAAASAGNAAAQLAPLSPAPKITLADTQGRPVELNGLRGSRLLVLFFFDIGSRSSLDCLSKIDLLARRHRSEVEVYGISSSPPELIRAYAAKHGIGIPVLRADRRVRELYQAKQVLPVGCVVDRDFKVVSYYQGGGAGFGKAIVDVVERAVMERPAAAPRPAAPLVKKALAAPAPAGAKRDGRKTAAPAAAGRPAAKAEAQQPSAQAPSAPATEAVPQNRVGKILNDNEW